MKAIILAAGVGSRLGRPFPKSLSLLPDGKRILGRQIHIYQKYGINEIFVVVGFKKELIMEEFPSVFYKYNPIYYITNTAKSLCCGLENLDDDVIWSNGDVVFDEGVIARLLAARGNAVAVDRKKCGEEEVKYRAGEDKKILEISKTVAYPQGEAVGVNKICRQFVPSFLQCLAGCADNDYFEKGIESAIKEQIDFSAIDISDFRCIEVDFEEDLNLARNMFS